MNNTDQSELKLEKIYVLILTLVQIIHILDFVVMMPLGPKFIRIFAITPVQFSTLVSAYTFSAGIMGFIAALFADRFVRKHFLLINLSGFLIGTLVCAQADTFITLLIGRVLAGAFGGVINACVFSFVADLIPYNRRGRALGVIMSAFSIASVLGIPLGLQIANLYNWHSTFYFIIGIGVINGILAIIYLPVLPISVVQNQKENLAQFIGVLKEKNNLMAFALTMILALGIFMIIPFNAPYMVNNVGMSEKELPLIYLVGGLFNMITSRFIGRLSDRHGSAFMFQIMATASIFPILLITNLPHAPLWAALATNALFMIFASGRFIPAMTLISAIIKPSERGAFMGLENSFRQLSSGLAAQIAGLIVFTNPSTNKIHNFNLLGYICIFWTLLAVLFSKKIAKAHNLK
ncbi:MAG: MFS transporter [Bacteriovoracaceae bacterium]